MTDNSTKDITQITDISEMIAKLKDNPEIVTSVATALGLGSPPSVSDLGGASDSAKLPDMLSAIAPLVNDKTPGNEGGDHRLALLLALKPYLNHERQEIIDYIIKFSKLGDMLKKLK